MDLPTPDLTKAAYSSSSASGDSSPLPSQLVYEFSREKTPMIPSAEAIPKSKMFAHDILISCFSVLGGTKDYSTNLAEDINSILSLELNKYQFSRLILHTCNQLHTGNFSLTFQDALRSIMQDRSLDKLLILLNLTNEEIYPELFNNPELLPDEFEMAKRRFSEERLSVMNLIELAPTLSPPYDSHLITKCMPSTFSSSSFPFREKVNKNETTLYRGCSKDMCLREAITIEEKTNLEESNHTITDVYCFDLLSLIANLAQNPGINPSTSKPFSGESQQLIAQVYEIELKMYSRYMELTRSE